jgi:hypothetical protein
MARRQPTSIRTSPSSALVGTPVARVVRATCAGCGGSTFRVLVDDAKGYVDDGRVAIDNNRAENQLRVVAVGRKNWLFAGSFDGATRGPSSTRSFRAARSSASRPSSI